MWLLDDAMAYSKAEAKENGTMVVANKLCDWSGPESMMSALGKLSIRRSTWCPFEVGEPTKSKQRSSREL